MISCQPIDQRIVVEDDVLMILFGCRRQALLGLYEPEAAKKNFEAILAADGGNKAAAHQLALCHARIRDERQKEKALYSNIFSKMAESDRQVLSTVLLFYFYFYFYFLLRGLGWYYRQDLVAV